jgi:hypothetical protein
MKTADGPCKVTGLTCGEVTVTSLGEVALKAKMALQGPDGSVHAKTEYSGPWPEEVNTSAKELLEAVETWLLQVHFDVEATKDDGKVGLFGTKFRTQPQQVEEGER